MSTNLFSVFASMRNKSSLFRLAVIVSCFLPAAVAWSQRPPLEQAQAYYEQDSYEACITLATASVKAIHCNREGYGLLGRCYGRLGQLGNARVNFQKALECDSLFVDAHYGIGTVALFEGDHPRAEQKLSTALRLDPEHVDALRNLSSLYIEQGRWVLARDACLRGLRIAPANTDLLVNIAAASQGLGQFRKAADWLTKALAKNPNDPHSVVALAGLFLKIGSYKKALTILSRFEDDSRANRWKGESYFYTAAYELALPYLKKGLFVDVTGAPTGQPESKVLRLIADAHYEVGQIDSALHYYERLLPYSQRSDSLYASHVLNRLRSNKESARGTRTLNTTFAYQGSEITCLQASVASLMAYWQADTDDEEDVEVAKGQAESPIDVLYNLSRNHSRFTALLLQWNMARLKEFVDLGYPAIAILATDDPDMAHTVTVVGFDERRDVVIVNDPYEEKFKKLPTVAFEESWRGGRNETILVLPNNHVEKVEKILEDGRSHLPLFFEAYHALKTGDRNLAASTFEMLASESITPTIQLSLGDAFRMLGEYDKADGVLQDYIQQNPNDALPLLLLSRLEEERGEYQKAKSYLDEALRLTDGRFQRAHLYLGGIEFNENRLPKAKVSYEKAATLYPDGGPYDHEAFFRLAFTQLLLGEIEDSLSNFRRSAQAWANFRPAWNALEKMRQLTETSEVGVEGQIQEIARAISEDFDSFGSFGYN